MYDVAIIGAGIIGTGVARELAKYKLKIIVLEKENDISNGTTKANSAIIHAGYDAKAGSLMAKFNALGNPKFDELCRDLDVPFKRIGSLVVAFSQEEMKTLKELYNRGIKNGIPEMEIINREKLNKIEPNISEEAVGALYAKTAGIIGPWELCIAVAENAIENGVELALNTEVIGIEKQKGFYRIYCKDGTVFETKYIVNAAGVYADKINNLLASPSFKIIPRRGQYFIMDKTIGGLVSRVIFQCPTDMGKGVLVAPTVHGNLLVGPDSEDIEDKENTATTAAGLGYVRNKALKSSDEISFKDAITTFAGLRAEPECGDFIVEESSEAKGFINVAGIKSPGLSSSPAIWDYVVGLLKDIDGNFASKENFNPKRNQVVFNELSDEDQEALIKKDPRYGRIICRCENITEGEIIEAIRRPVGAKTVDGVKRRCRPGSGRCQGGFCGPRVQEILARELGKDMSEIVKDGKKSYILTGHTKK